RKKGLIYHKNKVKVVPRYSYMVVARVKTKNPGQASVGLYDPKSKEIQGIVRVNSSHWQTISAIVSIEPSTGYKPKALYPALMTETSDDYCEVEWVEFWIMPKDKPEYIEKNVFEKLYFPKPAPSAKLPEKLNLKIGVSQTYRTNDDIMNNPGAQIAISYLKTLTEDNISAIEVELGVFSYDWDDVNYLTNNFTMSLYVSAFYVASFKILNFFKIIPKIGLGYGLLFSDSSVDATGFTESYKSSSIFLIPALTLDFKVSRSISVSLENKLMIGQITSLPVGDFDFVYLPNIGVSYNF
ncbi:MAG: hypothetical protein OEZ36_10980, partial [Spirochaetota bacterium]|nr:hypothetical protein [Spirochaetota bacterium]